MRANEFIIEAKMVDPSHYAELEELTGKLEPMVQGIFDKVYPGTKLYFELDDSAFSISTSKRNVGKVWGMNEDAPAGEESMNWKPGTELNYKHGIRTIVKLVGWNDEAQDYIWLVDEAGDQFAYPEQTLRAHNMHFMNTPHRAAGLHQDDAADDDFDDELNPDGSSRNDYFLTYNMTSINGELDIIIAWAFAGEYKGVTAKIIQATFALGEKEWGIHKKKTLIPDDDRSAGVWKKMAQQLGVEYVNQ